LEKKYREMVSNYREIDEDLDVDTEVKGTPSRELVNEVGAFWKSRFNRFLRQVRTCAGTVA